MKQTSPTLDREIHGGNRYLAAIVESSDDAIISKTLEGIIQSWNKSAERIFGYSADEVIGEPITILIPDGRKNEEPAILSRLRAGERVDHYETIRKRKDGTLINVSLTVSPIRGESGTIIGASKIARDITEAKRAAAEIQEAKEALAKANEELEDKVKARTASLRDAVAQMEEFSYSVSHDLRGPVRAMEGYVTAVLEEAGESLKPNHREYLERVIRGSQRMDKLIRDVLTYSKISRTEMNLHYVSLNGVVQDVIQQYPEMQPPHMEVIIDQALDSVWGHEPSLARAVSNLLANAKKFVAPGTTPKIELLTEKRGDNVRFWVKDNGIGIKPEYQNRLFGMFERVNNNERYEGTGIGLAIVRKTVERMGGTVGVESDGTNGSSFWIELPSTS